MRAAGIDRINFASLKQGPQGIRHPSLQPLATIFGCRAERELGMSCGLFLNGTETPSIEQVICATCTENGDDDVGRRVEQARAEEADESGGFDRRRPLLEPSLRPTKSPKK